MSAAVLCTRLASKYSPITHTGTLNNHYIYDNNIRRGFLNTTPESQSVLWPLPAPTQVLVSHALSLASTTSELQHTHLSSLKSTNTLDLAPTTLLRA